MHVFFRLAGFLISVIPIAANAYIGPGLGAGTIGVILGVVGSVFLALFAILWYPLKRLFRKKKSSEVEAVSAQAADAENPDGGAATGDSQENKA